MKKAILFDYGGTLDTNGVHWSHVIWKGYEKAGVPVTFEQFKEAYVFGERALAVPGIVLPSDTFKEVLEKKIAAQFQYLGIDDAHDVKVQVVEYCDIKARSTTAEGRAILQKLSQRYQLILVSNFYGNLECVLKEYGLLSLFADVVESSVVGIRKPNPQIFALALQRNHLLAAECVVVGDSMKNDIIPAQSLQIDTVWLNNQGWGQEEIPLGSQGAEIHQLKEILDVLLRARTL